MQTIPFVLIIRLNDILKDINVDSVEDGNGSFKPDGRKDNDDNNHTLNKVKE